MGQTMTFTADQINALRSNGLTYGEKLMNQSNEANKIAEDIAANWKGVEAQKCINALRNTADGFKRVAKDIEPLNDAIKAALDTVKRLHGDI